MGQMISIDVGSKKVCVAEGRFRGDAVTISAFDEIGYESDVVENGTITDRAALSFLINEIIKKNHMKSKSAVVTISSSEAIIRELKLPDVKLPQIKLLVNNEMSRIVRDDHGFLVDFIVTGKTGDNMLAVTASAIPKALVESYYTLLKEMKLTPYALSVPEDAISRLISGTPINGESHNNSTIIVLDIGYSKLSFYGFSGGASRFNRTDVSPMQDFVREIASISRLDVNKDLMSKINFDPNYGYEEPGMGEACRYFVYRLSEEIQKYTQYLSMNSEMTAFDRIYICGGISSANGLALALTESLHLPVESIQSVGRVVVPKGVVATNLCVAAGALIRK
ncbi:MAG: pilus assembly protein PilM [Oscillospiraceae bacterium]|nr:pilus assembly protein PilM [Oscillospiraceae bacterium]